MRCSGKIKEWEEHMKKIKCRVCGATGIKNFRISSDPTTGMGYSGILPGHRTSLICKRCGTNAADIVSDDVKSFRKVLKDIRKRSNP